MTKAGFAVVDFFLFFITFLRSIYIRFALTGSTACMFIQHQRPDYYSCISCRFISFFLFLFMASGCEKDIQGSDETVPYTVILVGFQSRLSFFWITFPSLTSFVSWLFQTIVCIGEVNKYPMSLLSILCWVEYSRVVGIYICGSRQKSRTGSKHQPSIFNTPTHSFYFTDLKQHKTMADTHPAHLPPSELGTKD